MLCYTLDVVQFWTQQRFEFLTAFTLLREHSWSVERISQWFLHLHQWRFSSLLESSSLSSSLESFDISCVGSNFCNSYFAYSGSCAYAAVAVSIKGESMLVSVEDRKIRINLNHCIRPANLCKKNEWMPKNVAHHGRATKKIFEFYIL